ncbi:MAG: nickel pincer cofactor biosynthesis protein LarB [Clostridiales bacterium]
MDIDELRKLLENIKNNKLSIDEGVKKLKKLPFEDLGFAKVDHHRNLRNGYPEVIYCEGKTKERTYNIIKKLLENNNNILATRANEELFEYIRSYYSDAKYYDEARIIFIKRKDVDITKKIISVVTAGTSDIPVAEEAAVTAEVLGNNVNRIFDVGVAGIHRLFANYEQLVESNVLVAVAGMEGALASVIGGVVDKPVIAVPTSIGYGANFNGLAALLTMLNSCSSGISVVNIDNGFGAGYLASMINKL